jgi:serine protease Do
MTATNHDSIRTTTSSARRRVNVALSIVAVAAAATVYQAFGSTGGSTTAPESRATADAMAISSAFKQAAKTVAPSVVHITSIDRVEPAEMRGRGGGGMLGPFNDDMLRRFFDGMGPGGGGSYHRPNSDAPGPYDRAGQGTGFVIRTDGYIVTNNHVVDGADELLVRFSDGREYEATVVGTDSDSDLAVIRIDAIDLHPVALGNSRDLEVGEWVIAVGSPFGLEQTVTAGIVSATGRSGIGLATYENYIQTDAAINPGNSGGPLLNLNGEVVGVNTAISSRGGGNDGIGFAIPSHMVRNVTDGIIDYGRVSRGWLGVTIQALTDGLAQSFGLDGTDGVLISDVISDGPAERAGLETGDVVTHIDGRAIADSNALRLAVAESEPGAKLELTIIREGDEKSVHVTLAQRPSSRELAAGKAGAPALATDLGMKLAPLSEETARQLGIEHTDGALVTVITPGSAAALSGLREGDVILKVDADRIRNPEGFHAAIGKSDLDAGVRLLVQRGAMKQFLILKSQEK